MIIVNYNDKNNGYHIEPFPNTCGDDRQLPHPNKEHLKCDVTDDDSWKIADLFNNYDWYQTFQAGRSFNVQNVDCYRTYASGTDNYYVISL